ncbi:probable metabolite transport protein CsbC isoform X2 [Daktulosphaira vitifoliae]|uniref:probable metabolite transport protein CsbC isoform X2 n=1 Tax=Daktulosphaira vitifoliae TaxID=58002 RepID=UPI0021AA2E3F|nr:probable metabolite transport protein CsbC isoform X2 [Daktulosphaira vitifoliae]
MKQSKILLLLKLLMCALLINVHIFITSSALTYSSIILAQLKDPLSDIHINNEQASWIASVPNMVCPIGIITTGMVTDKFGRKKILQISYLPIILGWSLLVYAKSFHYILIARTVLGLSYGCGMLVCIYAAEICPTTYRPMFLALSNLISGLSMFIASALGIINAAVQSVKYELLFVAIKIYPMMVSNVGIKTVWTFYTTVCLLAAFYGWIFMPETTGKTLNEITASFDPKKKTVKIEPFIDYIK